MKKSITCVCLSLLILCSLVFSLPITAFAAESYYMNINEPAKGDNQGYILLLVEGSSGSRQVHCISWTLLPLDVSTSETTASDDISMNISISTSSDTVSFYGYCSNNLSQIKYSVGFGRCLSGDGLRTSYWSSYGLNSLDTAYTYSLGSTQNIIGYQIYGDGIQMSSDIGSNNNVPFSVSWGDDSGLTSKLTELIALSTEMCDNDEKLLAELEEILGDTSTLITNTDELESLCSNILSWLARMDERLKDIQGYTYTIIKRLDTVIAILKGTGESTFEEPNTESISEYDKAEDELVSGADDTSDIENQIEDFEIDANASGKIWDIITQFFNCHPKIMGLVIGILCLGIIALILNR